MAHARTFAVIGLGTFGSTIAIELERLGNQVLGIDRSETRVRAIADRISHAVIADVRDEKVLEEAGLADYQVVVVAIGEDLESSILATVTLKTMGVPCLWVKALSATHARILARIGADRIIEPEREIGLHVAQSLNTPYVVDYLRFGGDTYAVNVELPRKYAGQSLADLHLGTKYGVKLLGLMRGTDQLPLDDPTLRLEHKDRLLMLGRQGELRRLGARL